MYKKEVPSPDLLRKLLRYEPDTGKLFWRVRDVSLFNETSRPAKHTCSIWNTRYAGKEALIKTDQKGYKTGKIFDKDYKAHRVIWAMETGEWPDGEIDHENHIKNDNRWDNLRDVSHEENSKNLSIPCTNTSGHVGVYWLADNGNWQARITADGKFKSLGCFVNKSDAIAARKAANTEYGYHENHGKKIVAFGATAP